ncbi:hypothetical protein ES708_23035 [subsurface metagenome]
MKLFRHKGRVFTKYDLRNLAHLKAMARVRRLPKRTGSRV